MQNLELTIVYWYPTNMVISGFELYVVPKDNGTDGLRRNMGEDIKGFFQRHRVSFRWFKRHIRNYAGRGWNTPFTHLGLPDEAAGLQPLADAFGVPVHFLWCNEIYRNSPDPVLEQKFTVNPGAQAPTPIFRLRQRKHV